MPSAATLLTFTLAGIVLVAIPGPSVLFIVGRALAHGRRAALLSVAGNTTGARWSSWWWRWATAPSPRGRSRCSRC